MLADVPRTQAGTAGGALVTAQRLWADSTVTPSQVHHAGIAPLVNLCFIGAAPACSFGLPRRLAGDE
ncbi:MAG TPA: hypothetical protein VGM12_25920 [Trebonia sp.]